MTLNISATDFKNLELIIQFPNDPHKHIKAYKGQLSISGESLWDKASAWNGTAFPETALIIRNTCLRVLDALFAAPPTAGVRRKIQEMRQGLNNIKQVYSARYGRDSVKELEVVEGRLLQFEPKRLDPEEADWELISREADTTENRSRNLLTVGQLPGALASVYAGLKTAAFLSIGDSRSRILNPGMQLASGDVHAFIQNLGIEGPFQVVSTFYLGEKSGINIHSLDEIKAILDSQLCDSKTPIIIPLNFMSGELFGRNHIALIVIKDNIVEYYDAKGVYSPHRKLADDHTLRDVLVYCQQKWTQDGSIVENHHPHQTDANNCGMFVCQRIFEIFKLMTPLGIWSAQGPSVDQIKEFRQKIAEIAYPVQEQSLSPSMDADDEMDVMLMGGPSKDAAPKTDMADDDELDAMLKDGSNTDDDFSFV